MLPRPTIELVNEECAKFDEENRLEEEALKKLRRFCPSNTDDADAFLKTVILDQLYKTRIDYIDINAVVQNVVTLARNSRLDEMMCRGDYEAVELIYNYPGHRKLYYSFATKFCSWHNPDAYPIYDGNVDECLWGYRKQDAFDHFNRKSLGDYRKFIDALNSFRGFYGLTSIHFKNLDKFLFRLGGRILAERRSEPSEIQEAIAG
jgi:hypothetical protein